MMSLQCNEDLYKSRQTCSVSGHVGFQGKGPIYPTRTVNSLCSTRSYKCLMTVNLALAFKIRLRIAIAFKDRNPALQEKAEMSGKIQDALRNN